MQNSGLGAAIAASPIFAGTLTGLPSAIFSVWHGRCACCYVAGDAMWCGEREREGREEENLLVSARELRASAAEHMRHSLLEWWKGTV